MSQVCVAFRNATESQFIKMSFYYRRRGVLQDSNFVLLSNAVFCQRFFSEVAYIVDHLLAEDAERPSGIRDTEPPICPPPDASPATTNSY